MSNTKKGFIAAAILLTGLALSAAVYLLVRPENTDPITFSITKEQRLKPDTVKQEQASAQALAVQALSDESDERELGTAASRRFLCWTNTINFWPARNFLRKRATT